MNKDFDHGTLPTLKRIFVAIPIPHSLASTIHFALPKTKSIDWINPSDLHLTVCFLGDVDVDHAVKRFAKLDFKRFELRLKSVEKCEAENKSTTIYLSLDGQLSDLYNLRNLTQSHFKDIQLVKSLTFKPHISLARDIQPYADPKLEKIIDVDIFKDLFFEVNELLLMGTTYVSDPKTYFIIDRLTL